METKPDRTFIISVRPQWAHLFFDPDNRKSAELRKAGFGRLLIPGDTIVIYATLPVGAAIGTVVVNRCECTKTPESLWQSTNQGRLAKVTRSEFDTYYQDAKAAMAIWVEQPELFQQPVPLAELRSNWGCWQPPQQIQHLTPEQVAALPNLLTHLSGN
jgi:predicted transcriptional regulator